MSSLGRGHTDVGRSVRISETATTRDFQPERDNYTLVVGLLLGMASGIVGVDSGLLGLRFWHVLLVLAFFIALLRFKVAGPAEVRLLPHDFLAVIFVIWSLLVEYVNSSELEYDYTPVSAIVGFLFIIAYWTARLSINSTESAVRFLKGFILPVVPLAILSAAQAGSAEVSRWILLIAPGQGLANRVADGRLIRATGLVGHWTGLGFFFCAMLTASFILVLLQRSRQQSSTVAMVCVGSALIGAFASLTLAAILSAFCILLAVALVRGRRLWPFVTMILGVTIMWYYFGDLLEERVAQQVAFRADYLPGWVPNTIAFRYKIWTEQTVPVALERSFWGWGNNLYSPERSKPAALTWISAESQWLAQWINAGLVSMVILLVLVGAMIVAGIRLSRLPSLGPSSYPFIALVITSFLASCINSIFTNRGLTIPLWVLFGVVCALLCANEQSVKRRPALLGRNDVIDAGRS